MANVEHSVLAGSDLHENKGVAGAAADTVATASGGVTVWQKITPANMSGVANPFGGQLLHVRNNGGGGTTTTNTWVTATINTEVTDDASLGSISSNQVTLSNAGTYWLDGYATWNVGISGDDTRGQLRLRNITAGGVTTLAGSVAALYGNVGEVVGATHILKICGRFTIAVPSTFEVQIWTNKGLASTGQGLGSASGEQQIQSDYMFWKIS